jgi:DNA-directed RNA polymerase specialized sigma24 family protein
MLDGDGNELSDIIGADDSTTADRWFAEDLAAAVERLRVLDPDAVAALELRTEGAKVGDLADLLDCTSKGASATLARQRRRLEVLAGGATLALLRS